ncbi:MAG TPA: S8 family peptidase [Bdellovibrionota bacterium]|jgi:subtilisin family serine protease
MLKLRSVAKFTLAEGLAFALTLALAPQAFGLIPSLKSAAHRQTTQPAALLKNWGLENNEHSSINARKAWRISKGSKRVIVAVIDTGIDSTHPDLRDNICRSKSGEYGFDFVANRKNPHDPHGHGSHVAGIIGASARNNAGASGVAPNICIMAVRYYSDKASGAQNLANTVRAINYAVDHGANVINYSGGGAEFSAAEMKAIQRAEAKGVVFVAAAGNEYQDTDQGGNAYYPAAYGLSNIIAVAATNNKNLLLPSSNWGAKHVHVAAPGENIFSTLNGGRYGYLTGTSQATAFVSGLAALILSEIPGLKPFEVRDIIMKTVDRMDSLHGKLVSGGRINAYSALRMTIARREGRNSRTLALLDRQDNEAAHLMVGNQDSSSASAVKKTIQAIRARGMAIR